MNDNNQYKYFLIFVFALSVVFNIFDYFKINQEQHTKQVCFEQLKDMKCFNQQ